MPKNPFRLSEARLSPSVGDVDSPYPQLQLQLQRKNGAMSRRIAYSKFLLVDKLSKQNHWAVFRRSHGIETRLTGSPDARMTRWVWRQFSKWYFDGKQISIGWRSGGIVSKFWPIAAFIHQKQRYCMKRIFIFKVFKIRVLKTIRNERRFNFRENKNRRSSISVYFVVLFWLQFMP